MSLLPLLTGTPGQRSRDFVYEDYFYAQPATSPGGVMNNIYARKHVGGRGAAAG